MKFTSPLTLAPGRGRTTGRLLLLAALLLPISSALAIRGVPATVVTDGLQFVGEVNVTDLANLNATAQGGDNGVAPDGFMRQEPELPPLLNSGLPTPAATSDTPRAEPGSADAVAFNGFKGLTHADQRNANNGNQFSLEPPDQALAVGNGFVFEGINTALNIFNTAGASQLAAPVSFSQFFGLSPIINRTTGIRGPFLTDPVVLFDPDLNRWFVVIGAQLYSETAANTPLRESRVFIGVSKTSNPTGAYNLYALNTTQANNPDGQGPRFADYEHIGYDRYGFYVSSNDFKITASGSLDGYVGVSIYAMSKQALANGSTGTVVRVPVNYSGVGTSFAFTVHPAKTPPGASPFLANGGVEFFVSSEANFNVTSGLAVYALTNTSSLDTNSPTLSLSMTTVSTQLYSNPTKDADQKAGPAGSRPLGESTNSPLAFLSAGDTRVQGVDYSAGRLWTSVPTEVVDGAAQRRMAAAYFSLSPTIRNGTLSARVITQGIVSQTGVNLLRPRVGINAQGKGAMVFTLVGPNDFPSTAFVPMDKVGVGAIQISAAGTVPEDGFTGYPAGGAQGTARWGDYSATSVDADGSIWMATEYVPSNAGRTVNANWGTFVTRYQP